MSKPYVPQGGNVVLIGKAAAINSGSIAGLQGVAVLTARRKVVLRAASGPAGVFVVADRDAAGNVANSAPAKQSTDNIDSPAPGPVTHLFRNWIGRRSSSSSQRIDLACGS